MAIQDKFLEAPWVGRGPDAFTYPPCPVCGSDEAETFYFSYRNGDCVGCDKCIQTKEYWEVNDEQGTIH